MTLTDIQKRLKKFKLDGFLLSRNNLFLGQDIRDDENMIMQLTGFNGSAGTLLIMPEICYLFVDGRYELQAPKQVDTAAIKVICTNEISLSQWLNQEMPDKKIGYNPWCWTQDLLAKITTPCLRALADFLPVALSDQPFNVFEQPLKFCGTNREQKIRDLAQKLIDNNLHAYFIGAADMVSWFLNLRSDALPDTPVFRAFALVDYKCHVWIFADNVHDFPVDLPILPLSEFPHRLKKFKKQNLGADFSSTSQAVFELAEDYHIKLFNYPSFCSVPCAAKNDCELKGIRQAHIRDGVAMCKFLSWLDNNWQGKTELYIVKKLHDFRAKQKLFVSESFATIAAFGSNGAIVHYSPTPQTDKKLKAGSLLLLDSGAQYMDGTTDITRTIALGNISPIMSEDYTLVLKAHINLSSAIFPSKTTGARLDAIARDVLWREGKNYNHGTGHGVGCFLNVHEGPAYISASCHLPLAPHYITSIEPGYYLAGSHGIRIENLVEVCESEYPDFLCFKNLTLVPIDKRAINKYLMTDKEIAWLNRYHRQVYKQISPHLNAAEKGWLRDACTPL